MGSRPKHLKKVQKPGFLKGSRAFFMPSFWRRVCNHAPHHNVSYQEKGNAERLKGTFNNKYGICTIQIEEIKSRTVDKP